MTQGLKRDWYPNVVAPVCLVMHAVPSINTEQGTITVYSLWETRRQTVVLRITDYFAVWAQDSITACCA